MNEATEEQLNATETTMDTTKPRTDYIRWEEYFMGIARLAAERSKDPVTQVGACIINENNAVVGVGYNGMPNIPNNDEAFSWGKEAGPEKNKHLYVCHAELNAILFANSSNLENCTMYVTLYPCNDCAQAIIQKKIKRVVYLDKRDSEEEKWIASEKMFKLANTDVFEYENLPRACKPEGTKAEENMQVVENEDLKPEGTKAEENMQVVENEDLKPEGTKPAKKMWPRHLHFHFSFSRKTETKVNLYKK